MTTTSGRRIRVDSPIGPLTLASDGTALTMLHMERSRTRGSAAQTRGVRRHDHAGIAAADTSAPPPRASRLVRRRTAGGTAAGVYTAEPGDGVDPVLREAAAQLEAYFDGRLRAFDLPLAPAGTAFQRQVWDGLLAIPFGETRSYGELADRVGSPGAARAVGLANGSNPIAIVIPCHRVIGADGSLTGYGGGIERKKYLLELEAGVAARAVQLSF